MKVYFAADHAGFALKNVLINFVRGELGAEVEDCGAFELDVGDDFPDFIGAAAKSLVRDVEAGVEARAILIGASGEGEAMAANRFKGVRAALYYGESGRMQTDVSGQEFDLLTSTRAHNDANALSLGARFLTEAEAKAAVRRWIDAPFSGDARHVRRIQKIDLLGS